jgi:hypothetical protein
MTWRSPDTYHLAGHGRGTATLKFYEGRDILQFSPLPLTVTLSSFPPLLSIGSVPEHCLDNRARSRGDSTDRCANDRCYSA